MLHDLERKPKNSDGNDQFIFPNFFADCLGLIGRLTSLLIFKHLIYTKGLPHFVEAAEC